MARPFTFKRLRFPSSIEVPPTFSLFIKQYYDPSYTLVASNVTIDSEGFIQESPLPTTIIDPLEKYMLKAVNEMCGFEYEQALILNPHCPTNYLLSPESDYCFLIEEIPATSPLNPENTIPVSNTNYSDCGTYIYQAGFNSNGSGPSNKILGNTFWNNGSALCSGDGNVTDGPLNRCALWVPSCVSNQDIGFSICLNILTAKTYYVGFGVDNYGILRINGNTIIQQDPAALDSQYGIVGAPFHVWHMYPITLEAGEPILEVIGHNDTCPAAFGCEVYDNTPAEIAAATSYNDLNLIFSTKDYVGTPVQLGSGGIGYSCPSGYALAYCESPIVCRRILTTPVLY